MNGHQGQVVIDVSATNSMDTVVILDSVDVSCPKNTILYVKTIQLDVTLHVLCFDVHI